MVIRRKNGVLGDVLMTTPTVKAVAQKYDIKVEIAAPLIPYLGINK